MQPLGIHLTKSKLGNLFFPVINRVCVFVWVHFKGPFVDFLQCGGRSPLINCNAVFCGYHFDIHKNLIKKNNQKHHLFSDKNFAIWYIVYTLMQSI